MTNEEIGRADFLDPIDDVGVKLMGGVDLDDIVRVIPATTPDKRAHPWYVICLLGEEDKEQLDRIEAKLDQILNEEKDPQ
jgi:hypothetical protein